MKTSNFFKVQTALKFVVEKIAAGGEYAVVEENAMLEFKLTVDEVEWLREEYDNEQRARSFRSSSLKKIVDGDLHAVFGSDGKLVASCVLGDAWYLAYESTPCSEQEAAVFEALPISK